MSGAALANFARANLGASRAVELGAARENKQIEFVSRPQTNAHRRLMLCFFPGVLSPPSAPGLYWLRPLVGPHCKSRADLALSTTTTTTTAMMMMMNITQEDGGGGSDDTHQAPENEGAGALGKPTRLGKCSLWKSSTACK